MFTCSDCGREFSLPKAVIDKYPGWAPRQCLDCRNKTASPGRATPSKSKSRDLTVAEVLSSFTDGPETGVFTDGASEGNPGPGGWGAVLVVDGEIVQEAMGSDGYTTNNKMELSAMIAGLKMLPLDADIDVYTDSKLIVDTLNDWAKKWRANGWKKKSSGPIANLELVKEALALYEQRPNTRIRWIRAHSGNRWNEYADSLATSYRRAEH
jgi:ribonuclease HI